MGYYYHSILIPFIITDSNVDVGSYLRHREFTESVKLKPDGLIRHTPFNIKYNSVARNLEIPFFLSLIRGVVTYMKTSSNVGSAV